MKFPTPSIQEYIKTVATVLVTLAILQYAGIFFGDPGEFNLVYLLTVGLVLPVFLYLLSVIAENTELFPNWEKMNRVDR